MAGERICPRCGRIISPGRSACVCEATKPPRQPWAWERGVPIALVLLGAFFVVTGFAARLYHRTHQSLARQWYQHGEAELRLNRPAAAVEDFRMALAYAPADEKIELLMLRAGDTPRAEREFLRAQWIDRRQKGAFAGAGGLSCSPSVCSSSWMMNAELRPRSRWMLARIWRSQM